MPESFKKLEKATDSLEQIFSTEEKIKNAARKVFMQKGFSATRTRDIAEEAGINLALLNYYFRSKEKLFELVMMDCMQEFISGLKIILNQEGKTIEQLLEDLVTHYYELFRSQPDLPIFILSEMRSNPKRLEGNLGIKESLSKSYFFKILKARTPNKINPFHFFMNIVSLTVFPFVAAPMLKQISGTNQEQYDKLLKERIKLVPQWIGLMLNSEIAIS